MLKQRIYIIGGKWRRKKIDLICNKKLRPTKNYIREKLFNWLFPFIDNSLCLDCFAGSGSLGLEALSRNASNVIFLEKNIEISKKLRKNLKNFNTIDYSLINTNAIYWLIKSKKVFNIVFIDPPFNSDLIMKVIILLEKYNHLYDKSMIYIETKFNKKIKYIPSNWELYRKGISGKVAFYLYKRNTIIY
ncbi:MAG: 16S rRNA (guanine(966)-N(2))-methyltransferase RsmD [Enterobacterales bacterium]